MKRIIITAGTAFAAAAIAALGGAGTAAAEADVVGKTYADASGVISGSGGTPVIAARVGNDLPTTQCIVSNASDTSFIRTNKAKKTAYVRDTSQVRVTLNCSDTRTPAGDQAA